MTRSPHWRDSPQSLKRAVLRVPRLQDTRCNFAMRRCHAVSRNGLPQLEMGRERSSVNVTERTHARRTEGLWRDGRQPRQVLGVQDSESKRWVETIAATMVPCVALVCDGGVCSGGNLGAYRSGPQPIYRQHIGSLFSTELQPLCGSHSV